MPNLINNSNKQIGKFNVYSLGITKLFVRNPIVVALWAAIFPGMGHILLDKYFIGFALFAWEILINYLSHLNEAIYYTFTGQIQMAKEVLDYRWLLLYCPMYLFAIWDSYRTTVNLNREFYIAGKESKPIKSFVMSPLSINSLEKKTPWQAACWSILTPGAGQMINHQVVLGFSLIILWALSVYMSHLLPAVHFTMLGMIENAKQSVDIHWLLNIPSIFFFSVYSAYVDAAEINSYYEWELAKYLRKEFSDTAPNLNNQTDGSSDMFIVTTFEYSRSIETAITAIQSNGIPKNHIYAVPLDEYSGKMSFLDSVHTQDGYNMFDIPMILAVLFSLFGLIYGILLPLGPILWALIGTGLGFCLGLAVKLIFTKMKPKNNKAQVVLIIQCDNEQAKIVHDTLFKFSFLRMGELGHN